MDTPRRWQVASLATAVASISLGGLMIARPTSEAVPSIDLDQVVDSRTLSVASPPETDAQKPITGQDRPATIVSPADPVDLVGSDASTTSVASQDDDPKDDPPPTTTQSTGSVSTSGRASSTQPADDAADDPDSPDSVASASSLDSDD